MSRFLFDIRVWLIAAATVFFAGCTAEDTTGDDPIGDEGATVGLYIRFRMNLNVDKAPGSPRSASARADTPQDDPQTPGTNMENAVNTAGLLVYDAETDQLIDVVFLSEEQTAQIRSDAGVCMPVYAKKRQKVRIYAAVNMTDQMRTRFIIGSGRDLSVPSVSGQNSYLSVINEFVPDSDGKQSMLQAFEKGGIPMTGQFRFGETGGTDEITITGDYATEETALSATADISRLVAKIHVLAKLGDDGFVSAVQGSSEERLGWIRLENVHYMPNGVNKSTYILPQTTANGLPKDLNMNLQSYLSGANFDKRLWSRDYVYLDGSELHDANANSVMESAEAYDATRLAATSSGSSDPKRYVKGMYCPENYFDIPTNALPFEKAEKAIPMVTTAAIAAKLTPRVLLVESDFKKSMDNFVKEFEDNAEKFRLKYQLTADDFTDDDAAYWKNTISGKFESLEPANHGCLEYTAADEKEARFIINSSIKMSYMWSNDPLAYDYDKYSDGTFFVYDRQFDGAGQAGFLYLTAGAVSKAAGEYIDVKTRSVPHIGGWGYYYTYIDNNGSTTGGKTPYTASQVTRNSYYLITVGNFGVPGGTVTSPYYIKVNTEKVGWDYAGKGDINLH